ncbi:MAG: hypothetical protein II598_00575, partial [Elusimicrobia bacterium]|nr:hypothetical protein [Elusimicrobiota bacterium]
LTITGKIMAGKTWASTADSTKEYSFYSLNTGLKEGKENINGLTVFGGKFNDGNIDMGGLFNWNGTIKLNSNISNVTIEKGWFARGVEIVGGVIASVPGIIEGTFVALGVGAVSLATGTSFAGNWNAYFENKNDSYLKLAASLIKDKPYEKVTGGEAASAIFSGVATVAAVAVAVAGIAASPFTAGASAAGGVIAAGYMIGAVVGTTVAAVGAARAAFDASENIQKYIATGDNQYLNLAAINGFLAVFSIATAGMAADFGNMGAQLAAKMTGKSVLYASAVAAAREGGKAAAEKVVAAYNNAYTSAMSQELTKDAARYFASVTAKYTAQGLGADVSKIIIKSTAQNLTGNAIKEGAKFTLKEAIKKPWVQRGMLLAGSSAMDGLLSLGDLAWGWDNNKVYAGVHDFFRIFFAQGMIGVSQVSENSWVNKDFLGIKGLKFGSVLWTTGYVFGPSIVNGSIGKFFSNLGSNLRQMGTYGHQGFNETLANIGRLFGGSGGGLTGAIQAWGSLGTNMYRMVGLNIGMGTTGSIFRKLGLIGDDSDSLLAKLGVSERFGNSSIGGLLNFVLGEMGVNQYGRTLEFSDVFKNSFATESLENSALFGTIMYALMPTVSGIAKGIKGVEIAEETATGASLLADFNSGIKQFINSIWEEGFQENIVQAIAMGLGAPAQFAEYLSEFAFPGTEVNASFFQSIQYANSNTKQGAQAAARSMTELYASKGYSD